jgi:hypothetical protein
MLMINTWQFSQLNANTTLSWIIFLLMLRGVALGMTVQTTLVTALSVVPRRQLPRGSSLVNATRLVVQSIGVAMLATVLATAISPEIQALQNRLEEQQPAGGRTFGLCEPAPAAQNPQQAGSSSSGQVAPAAPQIPDRSVIEQACQENITGFESAYKMTFFAAFIALILGSMLPGWPGKWAGRQESGMPVSAH